MFHLINSTLRQPFLTLQLAVLLTFSSFAIAGELKPFNTDSFEKIELAYSQKRYLVSIWSQDCPPCIKELKMFGRLKLEYPAFQLVLINTDGAESIEQVRQVMSEYALQDIDAWIYSGPHPQQLRYSIDPNWYGEMPRSYLYERGQRQASSGLIDEAWLRNWLAEI